MMIATTCLVVTLMILNHGQSCNSHVATFRQATDSLKSDTPRTSVGKMNDRLEIDEGSGIMETMLNVDQCLGTGREKFTISLQSPSGCYIFQTPGFNSGGYPNNSGSPSRCSCLYTIEFGAFVSGTVTVKEKDFQFQEPTFFISTTFCTDYLYISGVNDEQQQIDNSDSDDRDPFENVVQYCGTISEDKIRAFSNTTLTITLVADRTTNGNGAEIVICID